VLTGKKDQEIPVNVEQRCPATTTEKQSLPFQTNSPGANSDAQSAHEGDAARMAHIQTPDAPRDRVRQVGEFGACRDLYPTKPDRAVGALDKHPGYANLSEQTLPAARRPWDTSANPGKGLLCDLYSGNHHFVGNIQMWLSKNKAEPAGIGAVIDRAEHLAPVLSISYRVAQLRGERLTLLVVASDAKPPDWLQIPPSCDERIIDIVLVGSAAPADEIIRTVRERQPAILFFGLTEYQRDNRQMLDEKLEPALHRASCPTAITKAPADWQMRGDEDDAVDIFVPFWNDANSRYAIDLSLAIDPGACVTAGLAAPAMLEQADRLEREQDLALMTRQWAAENRFSAKLLHGQDEVVSLLEEAAKHQITLLGASRGQTLLRAMIGDPRHHLFESNPGPTILLREYQGTLGTLIYRSLSRWGRWLPTLNMEERIEVYRQVRRGARPRQDFFIMIALSAGIAALGLILNSAAIIIGAMLVAPLMSAIFGMGLGTVQGNARFIFTSVRAVLKGALVAIGMGLLLGLLHWESAPTSEMLGRAAPSFLDLIVAIVSGFAGAYALCRSDVSSSLPGVAIAVALVPPLATVGIFVSMLDWGNTAGALLLFLTNLMGITFSSAVVFISVGFRPPPSSQTAQAKQPKVFKQSFATVGVLVVVLAAILVLLSAAEINQTVRRHKVDRILSAAFDDPEARSTLFDWHVDSGAGGRSVIRVAVGMPGEIEHNDAQQLQKQLATELKQPVKLTLSVVPTLILDDKAIPTQTSGSPNPLSTVAGR